MAISKNQKIKDIVITVIALVIFILLLAYLLESTQFLNETVLASIIEQGTAFIPRFIILILLYFIFKLIYALFLDGVVGKFLPVFLRKERSESFKRFTQFLWWTFYMVLAASILIGDVAAIISSIGLIGLGLTFALQKPILNFVGWVTIIFKDIYNEGDRIKVGKTVGDVKEIQLMNTVVYGLLENSNDRSEKIVTIPNELVLTQEVENYTKDSNYIRDELVISITYESNYHKAMTILKNITVKLIKENLKSYIKWKKDQKKKLNQVLKEFIETNGDHEEKETLLTEKSNLSQEIQELQDLEADFRPKVRLELADSAILLIVRFITPYSQVKKYRTQVNLAFLDAIQKEKDIAIAYPHLEIIKHSENHPEKKKKKRIHSRKRKD